MKKCIPYKILMYTLVLLFCFMIYIFYTVFNNNIKTYTYFEIPYGVTDYNYKYKIYKFNNGNNSIREDYMHIAIFNYINKYVHENNKDYDYIKNLTDAYIELMNDNNVDDVLRYIALCKTESNFNNKAKSCVGAYGIPQVMLNIWGDTMNDKWNISTYKYKTDINSQLYVGFKIYQIQLEKTNGNIKNAHKHYSGGAVGYHNKITKHYNHIINSLKKHSF